MNSFQVREKLLAEGCSESNFSIKSKVSDTYCLDVKNGKWTVFYTERGQNSEPIFSSRSEQEACHFFYNHIMEIQHWHIVGFFKEELSAKNFEAALESIDVKSIRNDIPSYEKADVPRYRVFVVGKDIVKARELLGEASKKN